MLAKNPRAMTLLVALESICLLPRGTNAIVRKVSEEMSTGCLCSDHDQDPFQGQNPWCGSEERQAHILKQATLLKDYYDYRGNIITQGYGKTRKQR